ncbi:MAG TPA: glycosyltransferase family 87 protein [Candidatus Dormibacteraeota bacterium]|nr:glycosyltransferase family 87 protein [Candidatus Dormibacteraeota bacterium]
MPELRVDLTRLPGLRALRNPRVRALALAIAATGALVYLALLLLTSFSNMPDFRSIFVPESRAAWAGGAIYHPIAAAPPGRFTAGFRGGVDSPIFLFLLWPWTVLPDVPARLSWQALEIGGLALAVALAYRGLGAPRAGEAILVAVLVLFFVPVRDSFQEGQLSIMLGTLIAASLLAHQRGRPTIGGLSLGLAAGLKLTPLLLIPYFAYKRDFKLCLTAIATSAGLFLLTLAFGWAPLMTPFVRVMVQLSQGTAIAQNQAVNGFVLRFLHPGLTGFPIPSLPLSTRLVIGAGQVAVLVYLAWLVRRLRLPATERLWTEFSIVLLLLPLVQPFAWPHHFAWAVIVIPVGVRLVLRGLLSQRRAAALVGLYLALTLLEFPLYSAAAQHPADLGRYPLAALGAALTMYCALLAALVLATPGDRDGPYPSG